MQKYMVTWVFAEGDVITMRAKGMEAATSLVDYGFDEMNAVHVSLEKCEYQ
jgi:hypothetical protein